MSNKASIAVFSVFLKFSTMLPSYQPVFAINRINKHIDKIWFPNPIHWNSQSLEWEFKEARAKTFLISCVGLKIIFLSLCITAILSGHKHPDTSSSTYIACQGLLSVICTLLIVADALICIEGQAMLDASNWCNYNQDWITRYGSSRAKRVCTAMAAGNTIFVVFGGTIAAILVVYLNLDPFIGALGYFEIDRKYGTYKVYRYLAMIYITQVFNICFRTITLTAFVQGFYRIQVLKVLISRPATDTCIAIYKENFVVMQIVFNYEYKAIAAGLVGVFFCLFLGINTLLIGFNRKMPLLCCMSIMAVFIVSVVVHIVFTIGCLLFELSSKLLATWRKNVATSLCDSKQRKYVLRVIKSLQLTRMPAGKIGIVDRDIKVNYWEKSLDYIVDSIIINPQLTK